MASIGKLIQEFAYTLNGPEPIIAVGEKDGTYSLPRLRFRIRHSVENKATDLGLQNRVERFPQTGVERQDRALCIKESATNCSTINYIDMEKWTTHTCQRRLHTFTT